MADADQAFRGSPIVNHEKRSSLATQVLCDNRWVSHSSGQESDYFVGQTMRSSGNHHSSKALYSISLIKKTFEAGQEKNHHSYIQIYAKSMFFWHNVPTTSARWPMKGSKDADFVLVFYKRKKQKLPLGVGPRAWIRGPKKPKRTLIMTSPKKKFKSKNSHFLNWN